MKMLIFVLLLLAAVPLAYANDLETIGTIKKDPLRGGNNYLILDSDGNAKARIEPDPLWHSNSNRYLILDKKCNIEGTIKPDYIRPNRWIIETKD